MKKKLTNRHFSSLLSLVALLSFLLLAGNCDNEKSTDRVTSDGSKVTLDSTETESNLLPDTTTVDETTVPYTSLLDRSALLASDSLIGALIADGTKDYVIANSSVTMAARFPKPPVAYDQLSLLVYLEDLRLFETHLPVSSTLEEARKDFQWPPRAQQREPNHVSLAYPVVRKEYLSEYCTSCLNASYLPFDEAKVSGSMASYLRYVALEGLYFQILDASVKEALYMNQITFAYENPTAQSRQNRERESTQAALARQFNDKALREVEQRKQEEGRTLQALYESLKTEARNKNYLGMGKYLDEIIKLQEELTFSLPVQNNIIEIFNSVSSASDFPPYLKEKGQGLKSYRADAASEPNGRIVAGPALRFAKQALQSTPLTNTELDVIRTAFKNSQDKLAALSTEQDQLKIALQEKESLLNAEEKAFFELYQQSFQYRINVWQIYQRQLEELLDVPAEDTSFSYLLLQNQAVRERERALAKNRFTNRAKKKLRKLRDFYYQELRAKESAFEGSREER